MLFIGMLTGYLAKKQDLKINLYCWCGIIAVIVVSFYFMKANNKYFDQYYYIVDKLLTIPIIALILDYFSKKEFRIFRSILSILCWLGMYTLELYVIHIYLMHMVSDYPQLPQFAEWWIAVPIALLVCMPINKFTKYVTRPHYKL